MVIVKKQAVTKRNQLKLKKDKTVMQVKQEEENDNENMAMAVSDEEEDDREFESHKAEDKEHDLDLKEDDESEDSDEGFLNEKLFNLKKKANKLKVNKEEKKEHAKLNKAKKEGNTQNNENQALTNVTKENIKFVASARTKDHSRESREKRDARSLYIGKLPNSVTKQDLEDLSKDIVEIYIQKKTDGPNSRFAFIRFDDEATAETNYSMLQTMKIKDQPLNVDYVGSKSSYNDVNLTKERNARKLYVGNLPDDITKNELEKLSEDIVKVIISQGKKKFAFIFFKNEAAAAANLTILKTKKIRGQSLTVDYESKNNGKLENVVASDRKRDHSGESQVVASDRKKDHSGESQEEKDARSLHISKLPNDVTKQDLKGLSKDILEIYIPKKTDGPNSRFAYIRFDDEGTAETNYNVLRRLKIKGQPLTVDYVGSKSSYNNVNLRKERNARKLFVGDLPNDITEKELKELSEDIVEIFISKGKKKFGFLIFDSEDKAKSNYEVLKDKKIRGQPFVLNFTLSRDSITKTGKRSQEDDLYDGQRSAKKIRK